MEFVWPFIPGPIQGSPAEANRILASYNPKWKLQEFQNHISWKLFVWQSRRRKTIFFLQTPYIDDHYSELTKQLFEKCRNAYINYGVNIERGETVALNLGVFKRFSPLLVANLSERQKFLDLGIDPSSLVVTGMPGPFEVHSRCFSSAPQRKTPKEQRRVLLWAPHWITEWTTWGSVLPELLSIAKAHPELKVVVRAHPFLTAVTKKLLPKEYRSAADDSQASLNLMAEFLSLENVSLSSFNMVDDCIRSDWLLTDGVSIIAYWAATGKHLAITRSVKSPAFSEESDSITAHSQLIDTGQKGQVQRWIMERLENAAHSPASDLPNVDLIAGSTQYFIPGNSPGKIVSDWLRLKLID